MAEIADSLIGGMPEGRLEWHFDNWRRWMKSDVFVDGNQGKSAGFIGGGNSATFDELVDSADKRCAAAVDALMQGLAPLERAAINHTYLRAVYRFPRGDLADLLQSGRTKIARGLVTRGIY